MVSLVNVAVNDAIEVWEDEGGAHSLCTHCFAAPLSGTPSQIEWAQRIRKRVSTEFDSIAASIRTIARKHDTSKHADMITLVAIIEEKRAEVMEQERAGYFIRNWQDLGNQVRQMILDDPRYPAIRAHMDGLGTPPGR